MKCECYGKLESKELLDKKVLSCQDCNNMYDEDKKERIR